MFGTYSFRDENKLNIEFELVDLFISLFERKRVIGNE